METQQDIASTSRHAPSILSPSQLVISPPGGFNMSGDPRSSFPPMGGSHRSGALPPMPGSYEGENLPPLQRMIHSD